MIELEEINTYKFKQLAKIDIVNDEYVDSISPSTYLFESNKKILVPSKNLMI